MIEHLKQLITIAGTNGPKYGVITPISKPQMGKTRFCADLAAEIEYLLLIWNPAIDLCEDIGGFPINNKGQVIYTRPPLLPITDRPIFLVIDEVDKARRDMQAALLTLFAERRIRQTHLKDNDILVACMNEPRMDMEPALIERMLFVPFDRQPEFKSSALKRVTKRWLPSDVTCRLPERDGSARGSAWRLDAWAQTEAWRIPEVREMIVRGLLNEQQAAVALAEFDMLEPKPMADPVVWINTKSYTEIVPELCTVLCALDRKAFGDTLDAIQKRIEADKTDEWQNLLNMWAESGVMQETYPGGDGLEAQRKFDAVLAKAEKPKKGKKS